MSACPVFPPPLKGKASLFSLFFKKKRSLLDALYARSYSMKMGEVSLPGIDLYMVNQPDLVRRVMVNEVNAFPKHRMLGEILGPLLGESIFTTNGHQWRRQRDLLDPSFTMVRVQHVFALMQAAVSEMMARLEKEVDKGPFDIDHEMTFVTADVIFRTILSVSLDDKEARKIFDAFVLFQKESPAAALKRVFRLPRWLPYGRRGEKLRLQAGQEIRDALAKLILPRYEAAQNGTPGPEEDILSTILQAKDPDTGACFTFEEIVDQIAMLFLAGHETSASALTWSLYLLSLYPDIQDQAAQEVVRVTETEGWSVSSLKGMALVRDIFREALRLYPPVGFFTRECANDTEMRDKKMKKGSIVVVAPWLIHRHKDFWDNPHGFDPFRYEKGKMKVPMASAFMPFGMGQRVCIGTAFAMQEAALVLASFLKAYKVELAPGFVPEPVGRITVRSDNGMRVILKRRGV
ncbi:MAG: cytochrome P450 [Alphaproteobacteria bacterium]|nr:cytochrome P450 [Alphaproteobacteria bacterium]